LNAKSSQQSTSERASAAMHARDRAARMLGITIVSVRPGAATLRMTIREDMLNGHDVAHGGILFCLADTAFAHACNSYDEVTVASAASVEFLKSACLGDTLTAVASERTRGRRTGVYDVEVHDGEGSLVALFRGKSYTTTGRVSREA